MPARNPADHETRRARAHPDASRFENCARGSRDPDVRCVHIHPDRHRFGVQSTNNAYDWPDHDHIPSYGPRLRRCDAFGRRNPVRAIRSHQRLLSGQSAGLARRRHLPRVCRILPWRPAPRGAAVDHTLGCHGNQSRDCRGVCLCSGWPQHSILHGGDIPIYPVRSRKCERRGRGLQPRGRSLCCAGQSSSRWRRRADDGRCGRHIANLPAYRFVQFRRHRALFSRRQFSAVDSRHGGPTRSRRSPHGDRWRPKHGRRRISIRSRQESHVGGLFKNRRFGIPGDVQWTEQCVPYGATAIVIVPTSQCIPGRRVRPFAERRSGDWPHPGRRV